MPTHMGTTYDDCSNGYVRTQLAGALDIDCWEGVDWFHGGLQFQTVHHLWPRLPRHNLRIAQGVLISFCKQHGIPYHHVSFLAGNYTVLKKLRETAQTTKTINELFKDGFNLVG